MATGNIDELSKVKLELERTKTELGILYEISNAMRTTLKLDEILYIILTGVTAHIGLGFNRAILFLVNEKERLIEGKMAIGPESGEEANQIWTKIEQNKVGLDDLIHVYKSSEIPLNHEETVGLDSGLNREVRRLSVALNEKGENLLSLAILEGMPLHLTKETIVKYRNDPIVQLLKSDELVLVPLKGKDRVNGLVIVDNFVTKKPITKDDLRMLIMLSNQAGLAIENSQLYEKTVIRVHMDYLTELWNHGYFQHILQQEIEKAKTTETPLSLVMLDIDDFKVYNDTLGHQQGDKILKDLALLIKRQSRKMDYVCRYGGEEFTIILPQTDKREAFMIAERLRENIHNQPFVHEEILPAKKLSVSMGIATLPGNGTTPSELIAASDKALYMAKYKGKNKTCC
ncbi:MAG: sensor domain-containing diguanylate cyclase [Candidatus Omnitrophica bacterium]|nr:sensor domain-containing diguanylate cyclase [Candidatus Omnitrophota bacterium]